jgi:ribose 5-phosphate isomerase B
MHSRSDATKLVEVFLTTRFSGEPRHSRRIAMLREYEETGRVPSSDA